MSAVPAESAWPVPGAGSSVLLDALLHRLDAVLADLGDLSPAALVDADVVRLLDAATVAAGRVTAVQCRAVAEANRLARLGVALDAPHHAEVARLLADGAVRSEQARSIVEAVDALPSHVDDEVRGKAERVLLDSLGSTMRVT